MKACARKKGLSTVQLLSMRREEPEAVAGGQSKASVHSQAQDGRGQKTKGVHGEISAEEDFKALPMPKRPRLKQGRKRRGEQLK